MQLSRKGPCVTRRAAREDLSMVKPPRERRVQTFAAGHFLSHWCCRYPVLQH